MYALRVIFFGSIYAVQIIFKVYACPAGQYLGPIYAYAPQVNFFGSTNAVQTQSFGSMYAIQINCFGVHLRPVCQL